MTFSVWLPSINSVTESWLIDNLQVANMPGHSIKQTAHRKIAVKMAQITQRKSELGQF